MKKGEDHWDRFLIAFGKRPITSPNDISNRCRFKKRRQITSAGIPNQRCICCDIAVSHGDWHVVTLAVANVALEYPEVQVCYASTNQYNTEAYSSPAEKVILFNF